MLNENLIFLNNLPSPRRSPHHCSPHNYYYTQREMGRDYLDDYFTVRVGQEQCCRYEAAMQRQAHLQAMERRRKQKLLEQQRRQYFIELERKVYEKKQEERQLQCFAQLEKQRLYANRREKAMAAALEGKKRHQTLVETEANQKLNSTQKVIRMPDRGLYKIFLAPGVDNMVHSEYKLNSSDPAALSTNRNNKQKSETFGRTLYEDDDATSKKVSPPKRTPAPPRDNFVIKKCFNTNQSFDGTAPLNLHSGSKLQQKKRSRFPQEKQRKSSVLVVGVEDASDSECEEEFNNYWHNRRPESGKWIEPIEGAVAHL